MGFPSDRTRRYGAGEPASSLRDTDRMNLPLEQVDGVKQNLARNLWQPPVGWVIAGMFPGQIHEESTPSVTAPRYKVEICTPSMSDPKLATDDEVTLKKDEAVGESVRIVTATNFAESKSRTNSLPIGTPVQVFMYVNETSPPAELYYFSQSADGGFWARITDSVQKTGSPAPKKWFYSWVEVEKTAAAYGGWTTKAGGRSGVKDGALPGYNSIEDMNDSSGLFGNGRNSAYIRDSQDIKPIPTGDVVWMRPVPKGTAIEYWFEGWNVVDGTDVGKVFVVNLTKTSGSNGDQTHAATYVYTIVSLAGTTLATGKSPDRPRENGLRAIATAGYAYIDSSNVVQLAEAWEPATTGGC